MPTLVGGGLVGQVLLAVDNWVHKRGSDSATLAADLQRLSAVVKDTIVEIERVDAGLIAIRQQQDRLQSKIEDAEILRVERAGRVHSDFKRLESAVAQNHVKAMAKCEDLDGFLNIWSGQINEWKLRIVAIETWINRPVRVKDDDPSRGPHQ